MPRRIRTFEKRRSTPRGLLAVALLSMALILPFNALTGGSSHAQTLTFKDVRVLFINKKDCAQCATALAFLQEMAARDRWIKIQTMPFETTDNAQRVYRMLLEVFDLEVADFPVVVVGNHAVMGYVDHQSTGMEIIGYANYCRVFACADILDVVDQDDGAVVNVKSREPNIRCKPTAQAFVWTSGVDSRRPGVSC